MVRGVSGMKLTLGWTQEWKVDHGRMFEVVAKERN
jgi:hypothetical protein